MKAVAEHGRGAVVDIHYADRRTWAPSRRSIGTWVDAALGARASGEVAVRVVGNAESRRLNRTWRGKDKPTNVLSFPGATRVLAKRSQAPSSRRYSSDAAPLPLGDLVVCAPVVAREAREQGKSRSAHWAHMIVHGTLHLLGHDHVKAADAQRMERREIVILKRFGFSNPYVAGGSARRERQRQHG